MSSVLRFTAQNLTKSFVVTQDEGSGEYGAYFFSQSAIDSWYADNESVITKLGSVYIIPGTTTGTTFVDVLTGDGPGSALSADLGRITERKNIKDMGAEVVIGNNINARLLVLRKVQRYFPANVGGSSDANDNGYVVIENDAADLPSLDTTGGRFMVRVARV